MTRAKFYIITLSVLMFLCSSLKDDYSLINSKAFSKASMLTTDKLGNAYVILENQLLKFDPTGNPLANYSETNLGTLLYADAGNPMKVLLFYPDFARIKILDTKLAPQSEIDLRGLNINQATSACSSEEDGYWVYDHEDDQLKKIDLTLKVIYQSGNLSQLLGYQPQPGMMTEANGFLYVNNPETGILVFDHYGAYFKTIPYPGLKSFQVIDKDLLFINKNKLYRYETKTISEKEVLLPRKDSVQAVRIEQHQLYLLTSDSLNFYSF